MLTLPANINAPKNGYAYIYVSNESDEPVYFDNLQVAHNRGRIIEENHYYSFGLKITGISSRKLGDFNEGMLENKNLYNDKELIDEADLDWYDYGFRNYDAQIGRFPQLDPLTDDYPELTNYQYASNDPIANVDLDGLEKLDAVRHFSYEVARETTSFWIPQAAKVTSTSALRVAGQTAKVVALNTVKEISLFAKILPWIGRTASVVGWVLTPLDGAPNFPNGDELYYMPGHPGGAALSPTLQPAPVPAPVKPPKKDNRLHEQYVLEAASEGDFDVWERGNKKPNAQKIHLMEGDVWKYGTTVNPERRYTQKWLREKKLIKIRQNSGTKAEVLAKEKAKIIKYRLKNGILPPGNKQTN